jgi:outer membrane protein OmpA-like peptidoglycan-associated protein
LASGEIARSGEDQFPRFFLSGPSLPLQRKLAIGAVNDPFEAEADAMADRVMRGGNTPALHSGAPAAVNRKCECEGSGHSCAACEEEKNKLQRKDGGGARVAPTQAPPIVHEVLSSAGQPLDAGTRSFMEPRFGHDFSGVRVHTDASAAESARAVNASAYTVGKHIAFQANRYNPSTAEGRHLLAHELTHTLQQDSSPALRRKLSVDPNHPAEAPAGDPAAALTTANRFSMMDTLIHALCPQFHVDSSTGEVAATTAQTLSRDVLASGSKPVGCCCLSILTDTPTQWTIEVSGLIGAQTDTSGHKVFLNPTTIPVEFGAFTSSNTLAFQGAVPTAGHELCGHAALTEVGAHPAPANRLTTNVHDPTVNLENQVSSEQGVPSGELRGLAASGSHRGESVDKITIRNYPFNVSDIPAAEKPKIDFAAEYIHTSAPASPTAPTQDEFVSIVGHSDNVGSTAAKQFVSDERARKVKDALIAKGVPATTSKFGPTTSRFTSVAGVSDSQPPPAPLNSHQANWRRTEILMAGFPAGALNIPAGTPSGVAAVPVNPSVPGLKTSTDPCIAKLVNEAYP